MDKSWIHEKIGDRYNKGVDEFLEFAFLKSSVEGKIRCPCKRCLNRIWKTRYEVRTDLICIGFDPSYDQWDAHGEAYRPKFVDAPIVEDNDLDGECEDSDADEEGHDEETIDVIHPQQFPTWFLNRVTVLKNEGSARVTEDIASLASMPAREVLCYKGYKVNGFRFHTRDCEHRRRTQNSGIMVKGIGLKEGLDYYGGSQEERHQEELEEQRRLLEARHAKELAKRDEKAAAKDAQIEAIVARAVAQALQAFGVPVPSSADNHSQDDDAGG